MDEELRIVSEDSEWVYGGVGGCGVCAGGLRK